MLASNRYAPESRIQDRSVFQKTSSGVGRGAARLEVSDHARHRPVLRQLHDRRQRYALAADDCIIIGDRPLDTRAGKAAGVRGILLDADGRFAGEKSCEARAENVAEIAEMLLPDWCL